MTCELCGKNHEELHCIDFVSTPQPLKDSLYKIWGKFEQLPRQKREMTKWVYDNIYAPSRGSEQHIWKQMTLNAALLGKFNDFTGELEGALIEERVYMCVKANEIVKVWAAITPLLQRLNFEIGAAKYCTDSVAANNRYDTIVVYLRNKAAVWRFSDGLRELRSQSKLFDTQFKPRVPLGTGRIQDLPGISTALHPKSGDSFGGELCATIAAAIIDMPSTSPTTRPSKLKFAASILKAMKNKGYDIRKPWNRPRQQYGIEYRTI